MLCILSALKAESEPLINFFQLKKDYSYKFPVFLNKNIVLIAIGVGKKNILERINIFFSRHAKEKIYFINIGIAGGYSKNTNIGDCHLINKIQDDLTKKNFYPDILIKHTFVEKGIVTVENIVSKDNGKYNSLVDMESSEIFYRCSRLVPVHRISFLKIVSDYIDLDKQTFGFNYIYDLIDHSLDQIKKYFYDLNLLEVKERSILKNEDIIWLENISNLLSLTISQQKIIKDKVIGFRLKNPDRYLPVYEEKILESKLHQKKIFLKISDQISI